MTRRQPMPPAASKSSLHRALAAVAAGLALVAGPSTDATAAPRYPTAAELGRGPLRPRLLPGAGEFTFTMYGAPGDPAGFASLVDAMKREGLGNGIDPGPTPRPGSRAFFEAAAKVGWPIVCYPGCADMQIQGGDCVLGPEDAAVLAPMDRAGVFTAVQLGEWGYYLHNLSHNEGWFRDVYGPDVERHRALLKPRGLAGYDRRPGSRRECFERVRDYYRSRDRDLLGRTISVTGHSHYEAYAGEWGARCIGLEVGENIAFTQSKFAFARGASRRWERPWSVQMSPWFGPSCTTQGPLRTEGGIVRGLDAGHSLSLDARVWLHAWFAGAAMVTPENSMAIFFEKPEAPWPLTAHGRKAAETFRFVRSHDRGVPWTPVAVVLDHLAGYNGYMDKPWGILEPTPGDRELRDLFDHQLFPGADHIHGKPDRDNPEGAYLRPTPHGEMFDVLLSDAPAALLASYPVVLLAGDVEFDDAFRSNLAAAMHGGTRVLVAPRHREALGNAWEGLRRAGTIEVLEPWNNPATGRPAAIPDHRLVRLAREWLPVGVSGDAVEYAINRTARGWVVELVNNRGVAKKGSSPAVVDPMETATVELEPRFARKSAVEWRSGRTHADGTKVRVVVPPGETEFVELRER